MVTFACQECGKSVTFPDDRRGHVEECPYCSSYVDVPRESDPALLSELQAAEDAGQPNGPVAGSRTSAQLWIEVFAVLCLAYFPYLFTALSSWLWRSPAASPFYYRELLLIVTALEVSAPLLVIMAMSRDPWSLFGIVRPTWVMDLVLACAIWFSEYVAYLLVVSGLPASILARWPAQHVVHRAGPIGIPAYFLLLASCVVGGFAEELVMRGYLIPRLERLLRSTWLAVIITSILFGSYHLYQGIMPAAMTVVTGLVYALAFCMCRRLWPLCLAHAMHNFLLYL
jgi:membrane protease YdiL (CAAX protease family)